MLSCNRVSYKDILPLCTLREKGNIWIKNPKTSKFVLFYYSKYSSCFPVKTKFSFTKMLTSKGIACGMFVYLNRRSTLGLIIFINYRADIKLIKFVTLVCNTLLSAHSFVNHGAFTTRKFTIFCCCLFTKIMCLLT